MILTMPPAVPLATRPTHTSALYLCFSFLRRAKEQTHVSPRITLKERAVEEILFLSEKTQSILILENNTCFSLYFSFSLFLSFASLFSFLSSFLCLSRCWVPRLQGLIESDLRIQPPFASSMNVESFQLHYCMTPRDNKLLGRQGCCLLLISEYGVHMLLIKVLEWYI